MSSRSPLSRFTPSVMPQDVLERLFVARERMLDAILARVDAAAATTARNHTLLVGPRGSGKTHLISLVYHRTRQRKETGTKLQLAWLPEDPWTIVSYRHLLLAIAERLEPKRYEETPTSVEDLEALLIRRADVDGPIVVILENLDQILKALGDHGQQSLRHLLQAHRTLLLVATSTRLDRSLSDQAKPFYGFFTTTRLEPFDVTEAAAMLRAIAREQGNDSLIEYLKTDQGQARLRTITHLAGGQPRMWAVLASALTIDGLGELVELLLTSFDDLTPYYQEQLARLSGQQRLVVAQLVEVDHPVNVSELAEQLGLDQRSLSKTMSELTDHGWVIRTDSTATVLLDKRRTYYELAEPLARVSFQIKESRGEPLRLIVEFLKHWFDPEDLRKAKPDGAALDYMLVASVGQDSDPVVAVSRRLERLPLTRARAANLLAEIDAALGSLTEMHAEAFLRLPTPIRSALEQNIEARGATPVREDIHRTALEEFGFVPHTAMDEWISRTESWVGATDEPTVPQLMLACWLGRAWRFEEAQEVLAAATGAMSHDDLRVISANGDLARCYWSAGHVDEAISLNVHLVEEAERVLGPENRNTLTARANLGVCLLGAGKTAESIGILEHVLSDAEATMTQDDPELLTVQANLAVSYQEAGHTDRAITLLEGVITTREQVLGPEHPRTITARSNLATSYQNAGRTTEATEILEQAAAAAERVFGAEHPEALTSRENLAMSYRHTGDTRRATEVLEQVTPVRERTLGRDHPSTLTARANLAFLYVEEGHLRRATEMNEQIAADAERILGLAHPVTLIIRQNLATCYMRADDAQEAARIYEQVATARERTLGASHPITLEAREDLERSRRRAAEQRGADAPRRELT